MHQKSCKKTETGVSFLRNQQEPQNVTGSYDTSGKILPLSQPLEPLTASVHAANASSPMDVDHPETIETETLVSNGSADIHLIIAPSNCTALTSAKETLTIFSSMAKVISQPDKSPLTSPSLKETITTYSSNVRLTSEPPISPLTSPSSKETFTTSSMAELTTEHTIEQPDYNANFVIEANLPCVNVWPSEPKEGSMRGYVTQPVFIGQVNKIYEEIVHFRKNIFNVPSGKAGKNFISELTFWLKTFNAKDDPLSFIAMKVFMILPTIILQKPSKSSKAKEHSICIERR